MSQHRYVMRVALTVAMGGFLMGFDASVISGVVGFIETQFDLTKIELGWAVSSLTLTATLAMMVSGPLSDRIGRRRVLFLAAVLYAVSAIASALAPTFVFLVIARMIGGLGVGASLIIAPMYIAEIAPPAVRGRMVSFNQLNIVVGISTAFFTNYLILQLGQSDAGWAQALLFDQHNWRWMLGLETLPAVLYFAGLFSVPESPRWLLLRGQDTAAEQVLTRAVGDAEAAKEMEEIRASLASDAGVERGSSMSSSLSSPWRSSTGWDGSHSSRSGSRVSRYPCSCWPTASPLPAIRSRTRPSRRSPPKRAPPPWPNCATLRSTTTSRSRRHCRTRSAKAPPRSTSPPSSTPPSR
jgi:MFS family permease